MVIQPSTFNILFYVFLCKIFVLLSSEIPLNTQICLGLSYYKNYGKHYRYCYIIHFEIQYMHYKHTKSETHFLYPHYNAAAIETKGHY